jgi:aminopeptidase
MSTTAYEDFVWVAINQERERQQQMVELLDPTSEIHLTSGETTDLTFSVEGMNAINGHGRGNLPDGEVFTAPVVDSVDGTVQFDYPISTVAGR